MSASSRLMTSNYNRRLQRDAKKKIGSMGKWSCKIASSDISSYVFKIYYVINLGLMEYYINGSVYSTNL